MSRPAAQGGYVLVLVMGLLAAASFVALRLYERTDALRRGAVGLEAYAKAQQQAQGAFAVARYWMVTRALHPAGHVDGTSHQVLREDGRWYRTPNGAYVAVQDHRGLLSANALGGLELSRLLVELGLTPSEAQAWRDVLDDYIDTDHLHRLSGAERDDYRRLGLPAPRNDWLFSLAELEHLPRWKDRPDILRRLQGHLHAQIGQQFNPVLATPEVMRARFPGLSPEQWMRIDGLRRGDQLLSLAQARSVTGLPFDEDSTFLAPGFTSRITVWAPGMPRALDYNLRLTHAGQDAPWVVLERQTAPRPRDEIGHAPTFPLFQQGDAARTASPGSAAP